MKKFLIRSIIGLLLIAILFYTFVYSITYHPNKVDPARFYCKENAPTLDDNKNVKILNWNVQYFAGKNYIFFYDMPDFRGKDVFPSKEDITKTINEVARIIKEENPDILLLQEINEGSISTHHEDQLARLKSLISDEYKCEADAFYFKSKFLPQYYYGPVGMKLVILSKYKINDAKRFSLSEVPADIISQNFGFKRAILQANLPTVSGQDFIAMSTHLDAFSAGSDTMSRQVNEVNSVLLDLDKDKKKWVIAGDFNLLPAKFDKKQLHIDHQSYYNENSEIDLLLKSFETPVSTEELNGKEQSKFYTHIPNHPESKQPDRTIDYYFYSKNIKKTNYYVRSKDTLKISDHLPMLLEVNLSK